MTTNRRKNTRRASTAGIGDDLVIARRSRRAGVPGTWVKGALNGHRFEALVFSDHAESSDYELDDSRISKLWIQSLQD